MQWLWVFGLMAVLAGCGPQGGAPARGSVAQAPHLVAVAPVERRTLAEREVLSGTLQSPRTVRIFSEEEGRIVELPYYEGDAVEAGAVLARLDDELLRAELDKAVAARRQAELDFKRLEGLSARKLASEESISRARTELALARAEERLLRTRLARTVIEAPFSGVITERLVEPGDVVQRYAHITTLMDPTELTVELRVSELLLPGIAPEQPVQVRIDALGSRSFEGRVARIHPSVDPGTRLGIVEVALAPAPEGAMPGQLCRVTLQGQARERVVVPFAALRRDLAGDYVFRIADGDLAQRVDVQTGAHIDDWVEIVGGLREGERVVTKGFLGLREGAVVKVVEPQSATGAPPG